MTRGIEQSTRKGRPRVAWVTNILAHYRVPCFQKLHEEMPGQITFFLLSEQMKHRNYIMAPVENDVPAIPLRGWRWSRPESLFLHNYDDLHLNDVRPILRGHYDILILSGWDEPTYLLLWAWGIATRKKILFGCESTAYDLVRSRMKESYKRFLLRFASGCIAPGQRAFEYCRQLGMPESLIFIAPNATDRNYFRSKAESLLPIRNVLRTGANLHGFVILFVGRLKEAHKGISTLIQACGLLEKEGVSLCLVLAGGGPDNRYYRELVRKEGLRDIRFMGMLDRETLCRYYAMADVLVLPSRSEPWGFVLNEGMEFGLPLVVSEVVGAGPDLVIPGKNGFVIPVGGTSVLTQVLRVLEQDEALRLRMGETSCRIIERFSPDHWAQGVLRAVKTVADRSS